MSSTNKNNNIVLFDLDGTLTPPRQKIQQPVIDALKRLTKFAKIGIVSGSPLEYIYEQSETLWNKYGVDPHDLILMPCNGTQKLLWNDKKFSYQVEYQVNMKQYLNGAYDDRIYNQIIVAILDLQQKFLSDNPDFFDVTGHFVSYRESMLNWSMVGREAKTSERQKFVELDESRNIRMSLRKSLYKKLAEMDVNDLDLKLGGSTSIDIHPQGWDKTHALNHFPESIAWFVGDKCLEHGNDHSLFSVLHPENRGFATSGPDKTIQIILDDIMPSIQRR